MTAPRPPRPWRGLRLGGFAGLFLFAVTYGSPLADRLGVAADNLAVLFILGGAGAGLVGGLLWPFQHSRLETLVFAVPTALPLAFLVGTALGLSVPGRLALGAGVGGLYAVLFGGRHGAPVDPPRQD